MREIVLLPGSMFGDIWANRFYWMRKIHPEDKVLILANFAMYCEVAGLSSAYKNARSYLEQEGIQTVCLPEDSVEALLLSSGYRELYITPVRSTEMIVMSASCCGYSGSLFMLGASNAEQDFTNLTPLIRAYSVSPNAGLKSLDRTEVNADHMSGVVCHYTLNGRGYSQELQYAQNIGAGAEGIILPANAPGYCLKIWDNMSRFAFANEKIDAMLRLNLSHPDIALPLAFVYNTNHEPIGIVMKQFAGREAHLDELRYFDNSLHLAGEVIRQCIWLQAHGFVHCDMFHNILVNEETSTVHMIDTESLQFGAFPTTATSLDRTEYMPQSLSRQSAFHSAIEMTYTSLMMLIMLYAGKDDSFVDHLLWDSHAGCDKVNDLLLRKLPEGLQRMVIQAYKEKIPVSLTQQLEFVNREIASRSKAEYYTYDFRESPEEYARDNEYVQDAEECSSADATEGFGSRVDNIYRNGYNYPTATKAPSAYSSANKQKSWIVRMVQLLIMKLFGSSSGTVPANFGAAIDPWDVFIASKRWKKPMLISIFTIALILMMLVAIVSM